MICSPWVPFHNQTIPGTLQRYDGRSMDSGDVRQLGGFNLIEMPQYLQIETGSADPVVLTRDYSLLATESPMNAATFQALFDLNASEPVWGTSVATRILSTAFFWWYQASTFNLGLPRVFYRSDALNEQQHRWHLAAGIVHPDGTLTEHGDPIIDPIDWPRSWTVWLTDTGPPSLGGDPDRWYRNGTVYPLYGGTCVVDNDIPAGSRLVSPFDWNRPNLVESLLPPVVLSPGNPPVKDLPIRVSPWYR